MRRSRDYVDSGRAGRRGRALVRPILPESTERASTPCKTPPTGCSDLSAGTTTSTATAASALSRPRTGLGDAPSPSPGRSSLVRHPRVLHDLRATSSLTAYRTPVPQRPTCVGSPSGCRGSTHLSVDNSDGPVLPRTCVEAATPSVASADIEVARAPSERTAPTQAKASAPAPPAQKVECRCRVRRAGPRGSGRPADRPPETAG
jgi:hypothetical protein